MSHGPMTNDEMEELCQTVSTVEADAPATYFAPTWTDPDVDALKHRHAVADHRAYEAVEKWVGESGALEIVGVEWGGHFQARPGAMGVSLDVMVRTLGKQRWMCTHSVHVELLADGSAYINVE